MIEIISGTDRPNSNSIKVAKFVETLYAEIKVPARIMDLAQLKVGDVASGEYYQGAKGTFKEAVDRVTKAEGLVIVVPEYNGSYPGFLKLFIDYWKYPDSFEHRPIALIGLGARWGGLRPVEHLQQVFGYRNSYIFPSRVFLNNIKEVLKDGAIADPMMLDLMKIQTREFARFVKALKSASLDANSKLSPA